VGRVDGKVAFITGFVLPVVAGYPIK